MLVIDSSVVVAAFSDAGPEGRWAKEVIARGSLASPHLLPIEVTHTLRNIVLGKKLSVEAATDALNELLALPVVLFPYAQLSSRVWALRASVSAYDACYVALAEQLDADLATLDRRLTRAQGPRCRFQTISKQGLN